MKTTTPERMSTEGHEDIMAAYRGAREKETPEDTARLAAVTPTIAQRASLTWSDEDVAAAALFFARVNRERKDDEAMRNLGGLDYLRYRMTGAKG